MVTRRAFIKDGITAFTVSFAAPAFLSDLARAQGASSRNLVVLDLTGGNDGLSMLVPYTDSAYYSRRPTLAIPAGSVLQIGSDSSGKALGLHPKLTGLKGIFNEGRLALIQRVGYENSSRSHFSGTDIWSTANPSNTTGNGWVGRYLSTLAPPLDPLVAWNTTGDTPHAFQSSTVSVASIPSVAGYAFNSPNTGSEATLERAAATSIASHVPVDKPHVAGQGARDISDVGCPTLRRVNMTDEVPDVARNVDDTSARHDVSLQVFAELSPNPIFCRLVGFVEP